jgi:hypothetical protein
MIEREVKSSNVRLVQYNRDNSEMTIHFHRGGVYRYFDVDESVFEELVEAPSVGKAFHRLIRSAGYLYEEVN